MDLILWRHADAEDGAPDLARRLTPKGRKQAERVADWLRKRLPADYRLLASPAARAQETASALRKDFETVKALAPGASISTILRSAGWPEGQGSVILVGHQPDFGRAAAFIVSGRDAGWLIKKGGLWWLSNEKEPLLVKAVISPSLFKD
jgi:phosphohistidine phosphatase